MRRLAFAITAAAAAALAIAGCGGGGSDSKSAAESDGAAAMTAKVNMPQSYKFSPDSVRVKAGGSVTWTNNDNFPHNVTLDDGDTSSQDVAIGKTASVTFSTPGTYHYHCALHPQQMKGTVVVES